MTHNSAPLWTLLAAACLPTIGHAQGRAANPLPVDVLVLAYAPGTTQFTTVRIPARGSAALGAPDAEMLSLDPITAEVGQLAMFRSCAVGEAEKAALTRVARELSAVELLETEPGRGSIYNFDVDTDPRLVVRAMAYKLIPYYGPLTRSYEYGNDEWEHLRWYWYDYAYPR